ncbi:MAG TPA: hypothetical protein VNF73_04265 [Candidatus Saccharimonadales bacterium]|nr:hypothetical protein [Candidatus Saccharimonadales bacterium]
MEYTVRSISVGTFEEPAHAVFWMATEPPWVTLRLQLILIAGNGIRALVNTALPDDLSALHDEFPKALMWQPPGVRGATVRSPEELQLPALAAACVTPEQVTHVILTPIVRYTTDTLDAFPNAQICMSKRGWIHYQTTHRHPHDSRGAFSRDTLIHLVTDWWDRIVLLEDEHEIAPGLRTWHSGVHHRSSIVVEADTAEGLVAISDSFFLYENIEGDGWRPLGLNESFEETFATNARVLRTARHIVPLYDPRVFERYPGGVIASGNR